MRYLFQLTGHRPVVTPELNGIDAVEEWASRTFELGEGAWVDLDPTDGIPLPLWSGDDSLDWPVYREFSDAAWYAGPIGVL